MSETVIDRSGLSCLMLMLNFLQVPADAAQLNHEFSVSDKPFCSMSILRAAKRLGLKAKKNKSNWDKLQKSPLPAIAVMKQGTYQIIGQYLPDQNLILVQDTETGVISKLTEREFQETWSGEVVFIAKGQPLLGKGWEFDISWFLPAIFRYRKALSEVIVASFFIQILSLATPIFFQVTIDKVLVHRGVTTLDVLVVGLICVGVFEAVIGGLRSYLFSHTTNRVDVELGAKLFNHMLSLPLAYFGSRPVGQTVARVKELENIREFITGSSLTLLIDVFFTFIFFIVMWRFSPTLTYLVIASIPFYVILAIVVTPILRARLDEKFRKGAENQALLVESISGVETIKTLAVEPNAQRMWEEKLASYVSSSFKATNLGNIAGQSTQVISKITSAGTLYLGALLVIDGDLTVGQLIAFNMLSGRVTGPILRLSQMWNDFQQASLSVKRLGDILNVPTEPQRGAERANLGKIEGNIKLESVSFRYKLDGPEILKNINLDIFKGQRIGIVGSSGSGKSTLAKLIQRMYVPQSGRVLIDGYDIALVDASWLRRQVAVVLQESVLFNRSVRDNIALSDPTFSMERIIEAAKLAGAHDFILELAEGYDTVIDERGASLSGGQRQRIAIARALITNPRILIFDEATSALDYESEQLIQTNMENICKGRTVLTIAHRLSAVRHSDRIITIENGIVKEDGSHADLLKSNGRYAQLYRLQNENILTENSVGKVS
ncbi:MAG: type I secretion system permease/ATPase [Halopseudomonas aestusnigri]